RLPVSAATLTVRISSPREISDQISRTLEKAAERAADFVEHPACAPKACCVGAGEVSRTLENALERAADFARTYAARLRGARWMFDEVSRTLGRLLERAAYLVRYLSWAANAHSQGGGGHGQA